MVLEENLPDVPHLQDPDRVKIAGVAVEELESELLVLDDGFQHRRLARDLDIVLLDALEPFGLGRLFPRGLLREPVRSLRRADLVVLSRADLVAGRRPATRSAPGPSAQAGPLRWVVTPARADRADRRRGSSRNRSTTLTGATVAAFCGIGNPEGFRRTIEPLCGEVVGFRTFPDHHAYSAADVADLTRWARGVGGRSGLDHPEGFGEASRREPGGRSAARLADRPGGARRGRDARRRPRLAASGRRTIDRRVDAPSSTGKDPVSPRAPTTSPLDLDALRFEPLADRPSKVFLTDLGRPAGPDPSLSDWLDGLPDVLAARGLKRLRDAIVTAHAGGPAGRRGAGRARRQDGLRART